MKIDTNDYLTLEETMEVMGCSLRSVYRAMDAAAADGLLVETRIFGKRLVLRSMLSALKARHYPFGTKRRSELAVECGRLGGLSKSANARRHERSRG
jgi:hypothetical protein